MTAPIRYDQTDLITEILNCTTSKWFYHRMTRSPTLYQCEIINISIVPVGMRLIAAQTGGCDPEEYKNLWTVSFQIQNSQSPI